MNFKDWKILVTGGAGFIGSHVVDRLLQEGLEVVVVDNFSTGLSENLSSWEKHERFNLVRGDIRDFNLVTGLAKGVDAILHHAALPSVNQSLKDPLETNGVNVTGTLNLLKASVDAEVKRFVYASSCSVYGETEVLPEHEKLTPKPISPYGVSKYAAECYCRVFHEVYGLETLCLRYFNIYGPRQRYGPYSGVITIFVERLLANQEPVIYGDGTQTRDFTNVADAVEANVLALTVDRGNGEVLNIATGIPTTVNDVAGTLIDIMGRTELHPVYTAARPGDIKHSHADIERAKKVLGYTPKIQLKKGLQMLVDWFHNMKHARA